MRIDRANAAATMLRDGHDRRFLRGARLFRQAHLARSLRRCIGRTARELREGGQASMSFPYKTRPGPGS
jgi:hypothetical protein